MPSGGGGAGRAARARPPGPTVVVAVVALLAVVASGFALDALTRPGGPEERLVAAAGALRGEGSGSAVLLRASWVIDVVLGPVGGWLVAGLLLAVTGLLRGGRALPAAAALLAVPVALTQVLKRVVDRPRPPRELLPAGFPAPTDPSFPSGHTTLAAAMAVVIAVLVWRRSRGAALVVVVVLPLLVGASRVVLGVHHPSDVLAALVLVAAVDALVRQALPLPVRGALRGRPRHRPAPPSLPTRVWETPGAARGACSISPGPGPLVGPGERGRGCPPC